jgi:hypothetical protein
MHYVWGVTQSYIIFSRFSSKKLVAREVFTSSYACAFAGADVEPLANYSTVFGHKTGKKGKAADTVQYTVLYYSTYVVYTHYYDTVVV